MRKEECTQNLVEENRKLHQKFEISEIKSHKLIEEVRCKTKELFGKEREFEKYLNSETEQKAEIETRKRENTKLK